MTEAQIQSECFRWLWNTYPKTRGYFFHIPNEGKKGGITHGIVKGVPDMFLAIPCDGHNGIFIEFKKPSGRLSKAQNEIINKYEKTGYFTWVVYDIQFFKDLMNMILPADFFVV